MDFAVKIGNNTGGGTLTVTHYPAERPVVSETLSPLHDFIILFEDAMTGDKINIAGTCNGNTTVEIMGLSTNPATPVLFQQGSFNSDFIVTTNTPVAPGFA